MNINRSIQFLWFNILKFLTKITIKIQFSGGKMNQLGVIFKYTNVEKLNRTKTSASSWSEVLFNQFLENKILATLAVSKIHEFWKFKMCDITVFLNIWHSEGRNQVLKRDEFKTGWPSGLRRWIKAPISSGAWVRIPLQSNLFNCIELYLLTWIILMTSATSSKFILN